MPHGAVQTWGMYNCEGTSDDWFKSDYIIVWVGNPAYTRIPEIHFMHEARYRGAKLVVIAPDYNATAVHADYWINPRVGTDAALALGDGAGDPRRRISTTTSTCASRPTCRSSCARTRAAICARPICAPGGSDELLYFWDEASGSRSRWCRAARAKADVARARFAAPGARRDATR